MSEKTALLAGVNGGQGGNVMDEHKYGRVEESSKQVEIEPETLGQRVKYDMLAYLREFKFWGSSSKTSLSEREETKLVITEAINNNDVAMFAKENCGYCERAKRVLAEEQGGTAFTVSKLIGTDPDSRAVLTGALGKTVTFPALFIRGSYIGGADDLDDLVRDGLFKQRLNADPAVFTADSAQLSAEMASLQTPQFLRTARKERFYFFQFYLYTNVLRAISFLHVLLFIAIIALSRSGLQLAAFIVSVFLTTDLGVLVLLGPTPFSILGTMVTWTIWSKRGNPITSIPYKVIFAVYIATMVKILSAYPDKFDNKLVTTSLSLYIANSGLLAVLRF